MHVTLLQICRDSPLNYDASCEVEIFLFSRRFPFPFRLQTGGGVCHISTRAAKIKWLVEHGEGVALLSRRSAKVIIDAAENFRINNLKARTRFWQFAACGS